MGKYLGRVRSGRGDFAQWLELFQDTYADLTGVRLYPGTLNVELDVEYSLPSSAWRLEPEQVGGRVAVSVVPCTINGRQAFVLRTDANANGTGDHRRNVVEVASDVKLREALSLKDGDVVELGLP